MTMDSRKSNFSSWRGSFEQAKLGFKANQEVMANKYYSPVYRWKLRQWAAQSSGFASRLQAAGVSAQKHKWGMPRWPYIEPLKDAQAELLQLRNGLSSPRRIHGAHSRDVNEIHNEIVEDNGRAIELAAARAEEINSKFGDGTVHWRDILSMAGPTDVKVTNSDAPEPEPFNQGQPV